MGDRQRCRRGDRGRQGAGRRACGVYPRQFVTIAAIAEQPSFIRGDGAAAIAQQTKATAILLPSPFGLTGSQPRPSPANLTMDIVVMPRQGTRKMWGNVRSR